VLSKPVRPDATGLSNNIWHALLRLTGFTSCVIGFVASRLPTRLPDVAVRQTGVQKMPDSRSRDLPNWPLRVYISVA
jgi:hypothetical protein